MANVAPLQPVKAGPLSQRVFDTLLEAICTGRFAPGETLRELHLAGELNVSQGTIREALGRLERVGLVVRLPTVGREVTKLSRQEIAELVELRILLEERAFTEAARRMDETHFKEIRDRLDVLTDAIERDAYFESAQVDLGIHRYIWEQSGNRMLCRLLDQVAVPLVAFATIVRGTAHEHLKDVVQSHEALLATLERKDPDAIRSAARQHIDYRFSMSRYVD